MSHENSNQIVQRGILVRWTELVLFNVRWFLIPFYLGLVVVLLYYGLAYYREVWHFLKSGTDATIDDVKVFALDTIDIVMIANLIKMIITGSYNSFVSKCHGYTNENISSGELKVKIATSIVILSMVHMLKDFLGTDLNWLVLEKNLSMFVAFMVGSIVLAFIEYLHHKE